MRKATTYDRQSETASEQCCEASELAAHCETSAIDWFSTAGSGCTVTLSGATRERVAGLQSVST